MSEYSLNAIGYINAGGRGTRLNGIFEPDSKTGIAKALLAIGSPETRLIDHHVANFRHQGIEEIVVAAGDQKRVYEYVNDVYGDDQGILATSSTEQIGTGGDLVAYAKSFGPEGDIVVQNVDTILDIDLDDFTQDFKRARDLGSVASIAITLNTGVPNENSYAINNQGIVEHSDEFYNPNDLAESVEASSYRASSTGAVIIDAEFLRQRAWQARDGQLSIYRHILKDAWEDKRLSAYNNGVRFFRDLGTVATWLCSQDDVELQHQLSYNS